MSALRRSVLPDIGRDGMMTGVNIDSAKAVDWLRKGAQPTEAVEAILKVTGDWQRYKGEAGTEGTLAVTLGATVDLVSDPPYRVLLLLGYPTMADAADDVMAILPHGPTACEGLDSRIVDVVRAQRGPASVPELPAGSGWMFVELSGDSPGELEARAAAVAAGVGTRSTRLVTDVAEQAALWRIREEGAGLAARSLSRPAYAGWEDAAVPPARLGAYLREFEALLRQYDLDGVPYGHFGDGCVHVRIDFPFAAPEHEGTRVFRAFLLDAAALVARHGGSLSGEHGDGRARSELLPLMYTPEALSLFGRVKAAFDPDNLLNPGVLVDPAPLDADLRGTGVGRVRERLPPRPERARRDVRVPARRRRLRRRGPPVHRCREVHRRQHGCRRRDVPVVRGDPQREGLDTGPRTRAPGDGRRAAGRQGLEGPGGPRGARPLPLVQGVRPRLPHRDRHGDLQGGGAPPDLPAPTSTAQPLRPRPAPALGAPVLAGGEAGERPAPDAGAAAARAVVGRCRLPAQNPALRVDHAASLAPSP